MEASDGENFQMPLDTVELERASRVRITFKGQFKEKARVILQFCTHGEMCSVVETPGVLLSIKQRILTLQHVSSNNSGLYDVLVLIGNNVSRIKATLVIKPAFPTSIVPLHNSTTNLTNFSEHQPLYALLILPVFLGALVFLFWRKRCRREHEPAAAVEEARETPAVSRPSKKINWKKNFSDFAAVSFKACTEDTDEQLVGT